MTYHFMDRLRERGSDCADPEGTCEAIMLSVRSQDDLLAKRMFTAGGDGCGIYRFTYLDTSGETRIGYAVCNDVSGRAVTYLTHQQVRQIRDVQRGRARTTGHSYELHIHREDVRNMRQKLGRVGFGRRYR